MHGIHKTATCVMVGGGRGAAAAARVAAVYHNHQGSKGEAGGRGARARGWMDGEEGKANQQQKSRIKGERSKMEKPCEEIGKSGRSGDDGREDADDNRESVSDILEEIESVLPLHFLKIERKICVIWRAKPTFFTTEIRVTYVSDMVWKGSVFPGRRLWVRARFTDIDGSSPTRKGFGR